MVVFTHQDAWGSLTGLASVGVGPGDLPPPSSPLQACMGKGFTEEIEQKELSIACVPSKDSTLGLTSRMSPHSASTTSPSPSGRAGRAPDQPGTAVPCCSVLENVYTEHYTAGGGGSLCCRCGLGSAALCCGEQYCDIHIQLCIPVLARSLCWRRAAQPWGMAVVLAGGTRCH